MRVMTTLLFALAVLLQMSSYAGEGLKIGDHAPDFTLPMATKDTIVFSGVHLGDVIGKKLIILAFYPADWSGGCTKEMCSFRDSFSEFENHKTSVYAISGDYVFSHREWAKYHNLPFALLSDHNHAVAKLYDSFNPESGYNIRTVFVVDRAGKIAYEDLAYKPGMTESLEKLRAAISSLH